MLLQVCPALLHFNQHDWFPDVICEGDAATVFLGLANPELCNPANIEATGLAHRLKEPVEEDLGLTLFVTRNVGGAPLDKGLKFFRARHDGED